MNPVLAGATEAFLRKWVTQAAEKFQSRKQIEPIIPGLTVILQYSGS